MARLLNLEQRVDLFPIRDELVEHPIHCRPRDTQLFTHLSHCADLPTKPTDRSKARHHNPAAVSIVQTLV